MEIREAAPLDTATSGQLSFVSSARAAAAGIESAACLIVPPTYPRPEPQTVLRAENPRAAFGRALALLYPEETVRPSIHRSACIEASASVDPTAEIGPHVVIGARSIIGPGTRIGASCTIGANVHSRSEEHTS